MLIGEVSKKYNIGIETLRYYDKIGLLVAERRKNNRYYSEGHINKLNFIIIMKGMMFTLDEIKKILQIDEQIELGLKEKIVDKEAVDMLLQEISLKYMEVLEKEKEFKKAKTYLKSIVGKIQGFKRGGSNE